MALLERPTARSVDHATVDHTGVDRTPDTMRTVQFARYGSADVLELTVVAKPQVGDDDVLVEVHAAALNPIDWHFMTGLPYAARLQFGLRHPKVTRIGADFAGTVEAVGRNITKFQPRDEVFGTVNGETPDHPLPELGACSDYVRVSQDRIVRTPAHVSLRQAAAVGTAGVTALQGLRDVGRLRAGQHVLINGACGGVGTYAVQIAKALDAEVTAVCGSGHVEVLYSIGADHVVDYTRDDFTLGDRRYDVMLDNVGNRSLSECRRVMHLESVYIASFGQPQHRWTGPAFRLLRMYASRPFVSQDMRTWVARPSSDDLTFLAGLFEAGRLTSVIDRTYQLRDIACAMRHLAAGHARGKVVITL